MAEAAETRIKDYWNARQQGLAAATPRFWYHHPQALAHYRRQVSRAGRPGWKPVRCWLEEHMAGRRFERGLSIGCGAAHKEMVLLADGIVGSFDLFELSDGVIAAGEAAAASAGLTDRARFHCEDLMRRADPPRGEYDLVHWDNALHHMFDTEAAVALSATALKPGGLLLIDDYVGPSYMQVSGRVRAAADRMRRALPERYLANPGTDRELRPMLPDSPRIPIARFLETDPSEMADSANILPAVRRLLPGATVIPTGGILFFLGLRPLFGNFDPEDPRDAALLDAYLAWDAAWTREHPEDSFHAFVAWQKPA